MKQKNIPNDEFTAKRKARQKKIRKRRIIISLIFLLILSIIVFTGLSLTVLFPIKSITVSGSKKYSSEQIVAASGIKKGDNLFISNTELENIRKHLPFVNSVDVTRELPDTVKITVTDAKEHSCVFFEGNYYTVSKEGFVLAAYPEKPETVFEVRAEKVECKPGYELKLSSDKERELIDNLTTLAEEKGLHLNQIDITNDISITVKAENRFTVNLGTSNSLSNKLAHLAAMIKSIEPDKTGKINLSMWTPDNTEGTFVEGPFE